MLQEPPPLSSILSNVPNLATGSAGGAGFEMLETVPQAPKSPQIFHRRERSSPISLYFYISGACNQLKINTESD